MHQPGEVLEAAHLSDLQGRTPAEELPSRCTDRPEGTFRGTEHFSALASSAAAARACPVAAAQPTDPAQLEINTPIDVRKLHFLCFNGVNPIKLHTVLERLVHGADIGYRGPLSTLEWSNNKSAILKEGEVTRAIAEEVSKGHTAGPYTEHPCKPFHCNPLGAREKRDGSIRIILDLSRPEGTNEYISKEDFSVQYSNLDRAIQSIFEVGPNCAQLAKADLKHAFRLIPILPSQRWLTGFQWQGKYYCDLRLSFGLRSSCRIFNDLADVLEEAVKYYSQHEHVHHYLDDFFFVGSSYSGDCQRAYEAFRTVCSYCNIPVAEDKCCEPTTRMELLGCIVDTVTMTISLPERKVNDIIAAIESISKKRTVRQRDLLSVIGKLVHAAKCVPAGRSFIRRLLDVAYTVRKSHYWVTLNTEVHKDLTWWLTVLPSWNGSAPLLHPSWTGAEHLYLFTDASRLGYGGVYGGEWFAEPWPQATRNWTNSMSWLEMIPILVACMLWGHYWRGLRIRMYCDNAGVVGAWKKGWAREPRLMSLMRQTLYVAACNGFTLQCCHLPSDNNNLADALSRLQIPRFKTLHPAANEYPVQVPRPLQEFLKNPTEDCTVASYFAL